MAVVLAKLYGVERELEARLKAHGIKDSEDLLKLYRGNGDAPQLARDLGLDVETLMCLINRAQLVRIRGIGEAYTMLLEAVGVKSVAQLAQQAPDELRTQLAHVNAMQQLVGRVPALPMVNGWVAKAQKHARKAQI
jgi:chlorosome envelope protein I